MLDVAALQQENSSLREQLAELAKAIAKLNERVAELLAAAPTCCSRRERGS